MKAIDSIKASIDRMPPKKAAQARAAISIALGLVAALVFNYILYRVGLPSKPFIYVAF